MRIFSSIIVNDFYESSAELSTFITNHTKHCSVFCVKETNIMSRFIVLVSIQC